MALLLLAAGLAAISLAAHVRAAAAAVRAASAARALTPELLAAWRMTLVEAGEPDQARWAGPSTSENAADPAAVAPASAPAAPSGTAATPVLGGAMAGPGRLPQGPSEQGSDVTSEPCSTTHAALDEEVRELEQIIHGQGVGSGKEGGGGRGGGGGRARSLEELARAVQRLAAEIGGEWLPADAAMPRALLARTRALRAVVG